MMKYKRIISWSEMDDCWIATVPELPGCKADGNTPSEAIENVEVVIEEWIATAKELGRDVPSPQSDIA